MSRERAVVFDLGGVLFRWQPKELLSRVLPHRVADAAGAQALVEAFFQSYQGDWGDFDRGTIEVEVLVSRIAARTGLADAVPAALEPMPETVALLERLHRDGRTLFYLSNMPAPMAQHLEDSHAFLRLFRRGVFSARVRMIKPERAIFDHAAGHFGHAPQQLVFIDDHPPNVAAARAAGWDAVQFVDAGTLEADLARRDLLA